MSMATWVVAVILAPIMGTALHLVVLCLAWLFYRPAVSLTGLLIIFFIGLYLYNAPPEEG